MDPAIVSQIDQTAAALRDAYDEAGVNIHNPDIQRAIGATLAYLYGVAMVTPTHTTTYMAYAAIQQCVQ